VEAARIHRIRRPQAGLAVIDIQEKLLPAIWEKEQLLENTLLLIRAAGVLGIPLFATEQYPKGLGATVPEVISALSGCAALSKMAFSACGAENFVSSLRAKNVSDVILCGMESHVCVTQTCLDLLVQDFSVFVASDAVSSRTPENRRAGLERMRAAGATIVSAEMAIFELLGQAGTEEFKKILPLLK
jgi:nicotinamidase-related amidase